MTAFAADGLTVVRICLLCNRARGFAMVRLYCLANDCDHDGYKRTIAAVLRVG